MPVQVALAILVVATITLATWTAAGRSKRKMPQYKFNREIPAPFETLKRTDALINHLVQKILIDGVPTITVDEEADLLMSLFGLGRLVEVNVRSAWEIYATNEGISDPRPRKYKDVLRKFEKNFQAEQMHALFKLALQITDGLVHGDYYQAFVMARKAYEHDDLDLHQDDFNVQTIVTATFTAHGLTVDAKTGKATDSRGEPAPHRSYVPTKDSSMLQNFESFFVSGGFAFVYDVLKTSYSKAYYIRKCLEAGKVTPINE